VANIQYKLRGPAQAYLLGNNELEIDIKDSISFLQYQEYLVERYYISSYTTQGIVFAQVKQLERLRKYGWLTLMDSTHKTNKHDWQLFTLYIRDCYGCWNVGAHFFVSNEKCDTIATALKIIRKLEHQWIPHYFLIDQSSAEANSIAQAFPGLKRGEQECDIIYCTVHVM